MRVTPPSLWHSLPPCLPSRRPAPNPIPLSPSHPPNLALTTFYDRNAPSVSSILFHPNIIYHPTHTPHSTIHKMAANTGPSALPSLSKDKADTSNNAIHIQQNKAGEPIPIQLPTIYINPYSSVPNAPGMDGVPGAFGATARSLTPPAAAPQKKKEREREAKEDSSKKPAVVIVAAPEPTPPAPWWNFGAPHPLLWVTLGLSILAVVLGVPKGTLPTLTGRHRVLRVSGVHSSSNKHH